MIIAALWGAVASSALLLGAAIAVWLKPGVKLIAIVMAIGSGLLLGAVAYDLVEDAKDSAPLALVGAMFFLGGITFVIGAKAIERSGGARRKDPSGPASGDQPKAIALGSVLDGIPESFVLGLSVLAGAVSFPLLAGILLSNLPEGMASTSGLQKVGWPLKKIFIMWTSVVIASAISAGLGYVILQSDSGVIAACAQTFAGGALLAMVADTMLPESYAAEKSWTGFLVVIGFAASIAIGSL